MMKIFITNVIVFTKLTINLNLNSINTIVASMFQIYIPKLKYNACLKPKWKSELKLLHQKVTESHSRWLEADKPRGQRSNIRKFKNQKVYDMVTMCQRSANP